MGREDGGVRKEGGKWPSVAIHPYTQQATEKEAKEGRKNRAR